MGNIKILIAEDEAIASEDLSRSLENLGYQVAAVTRTGEHTIKKAGSVSPDLILMDIRLQGEKSGIDAAKEILLTYNIPIIYLTACADNVTLQKAKESSPYGFILKPFQIRELIGVIETALHRHRLESDIKAKQAWFSTTLNSIGDGVISTDTNSLVTFMNPMAETLTGWTQAQALGKPLKEIFQIVNEFTKQPVKNPVDRVLREGRIVGLANHTLLVNKNGLHIPIDDSGSPIRDEHGKITGVILVFKDISEKKKAENERRRMAERYQSIINSNHNAIYLLDTQLNYLLMNQAYLTRLGFKDSEQLIGKAYSEFHSDKNTNQFAKRIQTVLKTGKPVNYEYRSDRDSRNFLRTLSPIRDETDHSIQAITVISTDISEQRTAERSLGISETRFSTVFKNSPLGIALLRGILFDDVNPAFCKMLGYTKSAMKQLTVKDITHPDDLAEDEKHIRELIAGKVTSFQKEKRYLKKSGEIVWAKTSVTLIKNKEDNSYYTLALIEDISKKRKTEEALKESEKKYAAVFKSATDGFIFLNKKGIVLDVNDAFTRITDISRDQIIGKNANALANKFVKPKDLPGMFMRIVSFLAGAPIPPYELSYKKKTLEIHATIEHESGGFTTTIRDITAQKHAAGIQSVLFHISQATSQSENLDSLLTIVHEQLGQLIDTKNFFVALYDEISDSYTFPYMRDEFQRYTQATPEQMRHSLTEYVRRTGSPLLADKRVCKNLVEGNKVEIIGRPSELWMGVPLKSAHKTFGVVVVQSYHDETLYSESDLELLTFISEHIATAIERKQTEDQIKSSLTEKEVLLKEIHHRVKNNLQIIQSLLGLQTQFIRDQKDLELIRESQDRVRSIALVHENLYQSPNLAEIDFAKYIRNLAYALYRSYKVNLDQIQLDIKIKDIKFPVDRAVPCGLIINELLTNALKYAFPPEIKHKGLIEIEMRRSSKNEIELIFSDNGIGMHEDKVEKETVSLGLTLVKLLVEDQLKGRIKMEFKRGIKYTVTLNCPV
jgi:PAS domain S-box-containing protein